MIWFVVRYFFVFSLLVKFGLVIMYRLLLSRCWWCRVVLVGWVILMVRLMCLVFSFVFKFV